MKRRAVFLDRDGVINRAFVRKGKPYPPQTLEEFEILPGVEGAVRRLKQQGFLVVVATNQPDAAKGIQRREVIDAMHQRLCESLPVDEIKVCWCEEGPDCDCYKPKPGMLLSAAKKLDIDLSRSFMIGDRWRDINCGHQAGCFTIFIDRGYDEQLREAPDAICRDLPEAAEFILRCAESPPQV